MSRIFGDTRCDACHALIGDTEESAVQIWCLRYPAGNWMSASLLRSHNVTVRDHPGFTFLHSDCFSSIIITPHRHRSQDEINCFRRALAWRKLDHMRIFLRELDIPKPLRSSQLAVSAAARIVGLPLLGRLPMELVALIQSCCPDAYFWNMVHRLDFKPRLGFRPMSTTLITKYLSCVESWKRHYAGPVCAEILKDPECICITLDSDGIYQIERLQNHPHPPNYSRQKFKRYVLANEKDLKSVEAYFQDGLCCLRAHGGHPGFPTWDTPAPPKVLHTNDTHLMKLEGCGMFHRAFHRITNIKTRRLDSLTGLLLTFFCGQNIATIIGGPFSMNYRTLDQYRSTTGIPFRSLPLFVSLVNDKILWLEIRLSGNDFSVLLGTELSGVIHMGLQAKATIPFSFKIFVKLPQLIFCFNRQIHNQEHSVPFAIYPRGTALESEAIPRIIGPQLSLNPLVHSCAWSWAPLQDIHSVKIFEQEGPKFIGMFINYKNGGRRFIGDLGRFRLVKLRRWFIKAPTRMYVERWPGPSPVDQQMRMRVYFGPHKIQRDIRSEYNEYNLKGELHFWCGPEMRPEIRVLPSGSWRTSRVIH